MKKLLLLASLFSLCLMSGCMLFKHTSDNSIKYSDLNWIYGGFDGSKCVVVGDLISNLNVSGKNLSYSWIVPDTEAVSKLGTPSRTEADMIACLFVKNNLGKWVGGKFEWISVSRLTRNLGNAFGGWWMDICRYSKSM